MTPTFFSTAERVAALEAAATRWMGTPFRENSAIAGIGGGVSCHNLQAELYFETACLERFSVPRGRVREFINSPNDPLLQYLDGELRDRFAKIELGSEPMLPGDTIVLRETRAENRKFKHYGMVLTGGYFAHVLRFSGVIKSRIDDPTYAAHIQAIRRPLP